MIADNQKEAIEEILAFCEMHWVVTEVPIGDVVEMRDELRQHLEESVSDGKTVEDVVGTDTIAFAEEWAKPNRPYKSILWMVSGWTALIATSTAFVLTFAHLVSWSLYFPISFREIGFGFLLVLLNLGFGATTPITSSLHIGGSPLQQVLVLCGIATCTMLILLGINYATNIGDSSPLSHWSWISTLAIIAIAFLPVKPKQRLDELDE